MDSTQISNSFSPEVTTYRGFSNVSGTISLEQFFNQIASDAYKLLIRKIGGLIAEGNTEEAANVKRQLPFFTVTAGYAERRLPESITVYNDLVTIDIDGLSDDQVAGLRPLIEQDGATVGCFLTAKQHGYKIIAHLVNPITEGLRKEYLHAETIAYDHLEAYHARVYEETRRHYERLPRNVLRPRTVGGYSAANAAGYPRPACPETGGKEKERGRTCPPPRRKGDGRYQPRRPPGVPKMRGRRTADHAIRRGNA